MNLAAPLAPLAITMGDPAGIGPEVIARAFQIAPDTTAGCFVAGDATVMRRALHTLGPAQPPWPVALIEQPCQAMVAPPRCLPVLQVGDWPTLPAIGRVSGIAGQMAAECVVWAARAALSGETAGLVTAPLHKEALAEAGPPYSSYPGHTELLQAEACRYTGKTARQLPVRMMLANEALRVVLVSIHLSLRDAIAAVNFDNVLETLAITHRSLSAALGRAPRIGVAGLNPHAGEGGLFGREEIEVIAPAINAARSQGIDATGPHAPDTVFMRARAGDGHAGAFDVVVAMYHDQGLIPVKYLGLDAGVNITLGLPLVRTSPDHGTAFDLAGTGTADPRSLIAAIAMARKLGCAS